MLWQVFFLFLTVVKLNYKIRVAIYFLKAFSWMGSKRRLPQAGAQNYIYL